MYHQVKVDIQDDSLGNETNFLCENIKLTERLMRISRYFDMLTTSFSIMEDGWKWQYMKFRNT
jgi:tryptophan 2,3-dioxygenase